MKDEILTASTPTSSEQWYFFVAGIIVVASLYIITKMIRPTNNQSTRVDRDEVQDLKDKIKTLQESLNERDRTNPDCARHGEIIASINNRLDRLEHIVDSKTESLSKEVGDWKSKTFEKLMIIQMMMGEIKGKLGVKDDN